MKNFIAKLLGKGTTEKKEKEDKIPSGAIDLSKQSPIFFACLFFLGGLTVSPVLSVLLALLAISHASVDPKLKIEAHMEEMAEVPDPPPPPGLRRARWLQGFKLWSPMTVKRPWSPNVSAPPQKGLVSLLGGGCSAPTGKFSTEKPHLVLTWLPLNRVSFWVSVGFGAICAALHYEAQQNIGLYLPADPRYRDIVFSLPVADTLGVLCSFFAGYLLAAMVSEIGRWISFEWNPPARTNEVLPGYVMGSIAGRSLLSCFVRSSDTSSRSQGSLPVIEKPPRTSMIMWGSIFGGAAMITVVGVFLSGIGSPISIGAAALGGFVMGAAIPYSKRIKEEMMREFKIKEEHKQWWADQWEELLSGAEIPEWSETFNLHSGMFDVDLRSSVFDLPGALTVGEFRAEAKIATTLKLQGVVIETAMRNGRALDLISDDTKQVMVVYYTTNPDLGLYDKTPHLKSWETKEMAPVGTNASEEAKFALRLAMRSVLAQQKIPSILVVDAVQAHSLPVVEGSADVLPAPSERENVVWRIWCRDRGGGVTADKIRNKSENLQQALGCKWFRVSDTAGGGELEIWIATMKPSMMKLKDDPPSEQARWSGIPGGAATSGASETRRRIIELEWEHLVGQISKASLPPGFRILEQSVHPSQAGSGICAETLISPGLKEKSLEDALPGYIESSFLYAHRTGEHQSRISWGVDIDPDSYRNPSESQKVRRETLINAWRKYWGKGDNPKLPVVEDVIFHTGEDIGVEGLDIIELRCSSGRSDPLGTLRIEDVAQAMGNMRVEWLRVGQPFDSEEGGRYYSISVSISQIPKIPLNTELGKWVYALDRVWDFAVGKHSMWGLRMERLAPVDKSEQMYQSDWVLPPGINYHHFSEAVHSLTEHVGIAIPGKSGEGKEAYAHLVMGEKMPAEAEEWADSQTQDRVVAWGWENMLSRCKIETADHHTPKLMSTKIVGKTYVHEVELPVGMSENDFFAKTQDIRVAGKYMYVEIEERGRNKLAIVCSYEDPLPDMLALQDMLPMPSRWHKIPLGVGVRPADKTEKGENPFSLFWDLKACPHIMVTGTTGSGKTSLICVMGSYLISRGHRLWIIDPTKKGADFAGIKEDPRFAERTAFTLEDASELIEDAYKETKRRIELNSNHDVGSWYALPPSVRPRPITIAIDEAFSMLATSKVQTEMSKLENAMKSSMNDNLSRIAREARAAGVHLILAAQRPDRSVIQGEMQANLGARILLGSTDSSQRQMSLGDVTNLPDMHVMCKGRGYFSQDSDVQIIQSFYAGEKEDIVKRLNRCMEIAKKRREKKQMAKASQI